MSLVEHRRVYRHVVDLNVESGIWLVVEHSLDLIARKQGVLVRHANGQVLLKRGPMPLRELVSLDEGGLLGLMVIGHQSHILYGKDWEVMRGTQESIN